MTESYPTPQNQNSEPEFNPALTENSSENPFESDINQAKTLYTEGHIDEAVDLLEEVLDKAYRDGNMEIYDNVVDLLDKWEE